MVWGGICSKGKTKLRIVEKGAKINSVYYIENILKPFLAEDIPRLYPKNDYIFHQNSAPITAHSRLKLYELLKQLDRRVLYFDTDSVIYTCGPYEQSLRCGSNFGDLADEIAGNYGPGARSY
jgi:hypothetical protein